MGRTYGAALRLDDFQSMSLTLPGRDPFITDRGLVRVPSRIEVSYTSGTRLTHYTFTTDSLHTYTLYTFTSALSRVSSRDTFASGTRFEEQPEVIGPLRDRLIPRSSTYVTVEAGTFICSLAAYGRADDFSAARSSRACDLFLSRIHSFYPDRAERPHDSVESRPFPTSGWLRAHSRRHSVRPGFDAASSRWFVQLRDAAAFFQRTPHRRLVGV